MATPKVAMISFWRDDEDRDIHLRADHLINKSLVYPNLRFIWVVGDSYDGTFNILSKKSDNNSHISVINHYTYERSRWSSLSKSANFGFDHVRDDDDYVMIHESDITSPHFIVNTLVEQAENGYCPVAAWPVYKNQFYDVWAFRKDGELFSFNPYAQFNISSRTREPFEVDSVGTVWLMYAEDLRKGARIQDDQCAVGLCNTFKKMGRRIWCLPWVFVVQPEKFYHFNDIGEAPL